MPEETNLVTASETNTDDFWDGDFEDAFEGETTEETTEEPAAAQETETADNQGEKEKTAGEAPQSEVQTQATTLRVKYNGQEMDMPIEQAIPLIQKGMNYDHVNEQLTALKNAPERQMIESLARASGKTTQEYMRDVTAAMETQKVRAIMAQNPGMTKETAMQMLEKDKQLEQARSELETARQSEAQGQSEIKRNQMLRDFFTRHSDLSPKDIPQEVLKAVGEGGDMENAYMAWQNKQLSAQLQEMQAKLAALETNQNNKAKTVGTVENAAPQEPRDEVWEAFLKG